MNLSISEEKERKNKRKRGWRWREREENWSKELLKGLFGDRPSKEPHIFHPCFSTISPRKSTFLILLWKICRMSR